MEVRERSVARRRRRRRRRGRRGRGVSLTVTVRLTEAGEGSRQEERGPLLLLPSRERGGRGLPLSSAWEGGEGGGETGGGMPPCMRGCKDHVRGTDWRP